MRRSRIVLFFLPTAELNTEQLQALVVDRHGNGLGLTELSVTIKRHRRNTSISRSGRVIAIISTTPIDQIDTEQLRSLAEPLSIWIRGWRASIKKCCTTKYVINNSLTKLPS